MNRSTMGCVVLVLLGLACSTEVTVFGSGTGASGGSGGAGGSGAGGAGGQGNGNPQGGSGGVACGPRPQDTFDMLLATPFDGSFGCSLFFESETGTYQLQGRVVESTPDGVVVDTCPPNADCEASLNRLSYGALELVNPVPAEAFVEVTVRVDIPMGCSHELMVRNLPSWGGEDNPVYRGDVVWLAGADGIPQAPPGAPFNVTAIPTGCYPNEWEDDHVLQLDTPLSSESRVLAMGQESVWVWDSGVDATYQTVRNLRSFETGAVDDYWNWGYWMTGTPFSQR
jgi:hypothetical protein